MTDTPELPPLPPYIHDALDEARKDAARLREALTELRDRIKGHPAYAELTEDEELDVGGETAELSYLARVADAAMKESP